MGRSSIWPQIFAAGAASLIMFCSGFHQGWLPTMTFDESSSGTMTSRQISWMIAFLPIGSIGGAIVAIFLIDSVGRKPTLLFTAIPHIISCALTVVARIYWLFYIARFLAGLSFGVGLMVTPIYIGEISEGKIRGGLCVLMFVMLQLGQLLVFTISPWIAIPAQGIVAATISVVFATALLWAPESPYYYAMKRNGKELRKSLAWLRGTHDVTQEAQEIENNIALNRRGGVNFIYLFTLSSNRKAFLTIIGLVSGQLLSRNLLVSSYAIKFIESTELHIDFHLRQMILLLIELVITILTVFLADTVGRRPLLLTSVSLCTIFISVETVYYQLEASGIDVTGILWILPVASIGYFIGFTIGLKTLPSVIAAEIFSCEIKASALGISTAYFIVAGVGVAQLFLLASYHFSVHVMLYIFGACNILFIIFVVLFVPETKGRSLGEIQISLQERFKPEF